MLYSLLLTKYKPLANTKRTIATPDKELTPVLAALAPLFSEVE